MCHTFSSIEVPVAASMVQLARKAEHPFQKFGCYWIAFNNIYSVLSAETEFGPKAEKKRDGSSKIKEVSGIWMPVVRLEERKQIKGVFNRFCDELKDQLIIHPSTDFFANRTPSWKGQEIGCNAMGQRLNGVLNVGKTLAREAPVWSPIVRTTYECYRTNPQENARDDLAEQILWLLYTIRNNLFHASKLPDDANQTVVSKAVPMLQMIISHFLPDADESLECHS